MTTRDEWRKKVAGWKASGLTAGEFGKRYGLSKKQLHNWSYRLGMSGRPSPETTGPAVQLLRVVRRGSDVLKSVADECGHGGIRLNVAGASVDIAPGFDEATLRKVLVVVSEVQGAER